ncbi:MAG TPA: RHS repeat-associated core domain-containing protein, partial [Emticicia sp.]
PNSLTNKYQYNGKEKISDMDIGLYEYGFRWYDAENARFTQIDPMIEKRDWLTGYNYVQNNPTSRFDFLGLIDLDGDGKDDTPNLLKEVVVKAQKREVSKEWNNFITKLGPDGFENFKASVFEKKLIPYQDNFAATIYGRDSEGNVMIPDEILERLYEETEKEAMGDLATAWAMLQSGEDPSSFSFNINPIAQVNYINSYVYTGIDNNEAKSIVTGVGVQVALAYVGNIKASPFIKVVKARGGKIDGFTIGTRKGYGAQPRFDFHTISTKKMQGKWANGKRLPHWHAGRGNKLHKHRPWE